MKTTKERKDGWYFVEGIKEDHWIDLYYFEGGSPWAKASVKLDGCVHYNDVSNYPYELGKPVEEIQLESYLHICSIDRHIEKLQQLKKAAQEHFGEWPR